MDAIRYALKGKKTYIVAAGIILYHVLGHFLYGQPYDLPGILQGLGLATLRAGVAAQN